MIEWVFIIISQIIFWLSVLAGNKLGENFDYKKQPYKFWESLASVGFWLTFLGVAILI